MAPWIFSGEASASHWPRERTRYSLEAVESVMRCLVRGSSEDAKLTVEIDVPGFEMQWASAVRMMMHQQFSEAPDESPHSACQRMGTDRGIDLPMGPRRHPLRRLVPAGRR